MTVNASIKLKKPIVPDLFNALGDAAHVIADVLEVNGDMPFTEPNEEVTLVGFTTNLEINLQITPSELDFFHVSISNDIPQPKKQS